MICRYVRYPHAGSPAVEWVPMGLHGSVCALRRSDPERWNQELRDKGIDVEASDKACFQSLDGTWEACPLCKPREGERPAA
jgi:hypothetical protein